MSENRRSRRWTRPARKPGNNFNLTEAVPTATVDRDWHFYPNVGIWGFWIDSNTEVEGWEPYLNRNRYPTINYGQIDAAGLLARPIAQLDGLIQAVLARTNKRLVFVCHSRGGLLLRAFLQRNRSNCPYSSESPVRSRCTPRIKDPA